MDASQGSSIGNKFHVQYWERLNVKTLIHLIYEWLHMSYHISWRALSKKSFNKIKKQQFSLAKIFFLFILVIYLFIHGNKIIKKILYNI